MSRYARKGDDNQGQVVDALRAAGVTVEPGLSRLGNGAPDLLCGHHGMLFLLEVKDGRKPPSRRALTEAEERFHQRWMGYQVYVVESAEEAVEVVTGKRVTIGRKQP